VRFGLLADWFAEQHESATSKDFYQVLQGKMLVEIGEMHSFKRDEVTLVKGIITNVNDRYRGSFERRAADHPRQCIFAGTSNRWTHDDDTGSRRFWPIQCQSKVDVAAIAAERSQLFAEAVARYKAGESWWEMPVEETREQQQARFNVPAVAEPIAHYITHERTCYDDDAFQWQLRQEPLTKLTMAEVLEHALALSKSQWTTQTERSVARALRWLGWDNKPKKENGKTVRYWRPTEGGAERREREVTPTP
jgi:predicted P-loop ATPase